MDSNNILCLYEETQTYRGKRTTVYDTANTKLLSELYVLDETSNGTLITCTHVVKALPLRLCVSM